VIDLIEDFEDEDTGALLLVFELLPENLLQVRGRGCVCVCSYMACVCAYFNRAYCPVCVKVSLHA
jgi:hypothetical protein